MNHIATSMPYSDSSYGNVLVGMPTMAPMSSMPNDSSIYGEGIRSMPTHQSMSARTSRSNSLIRPGSGVEENRRSLSALEFANSRANFNNNEFRGSNGLPSNLSHDMNAYAPQQNQTSAAAPNTANHYSYGHAAGHSEMPQNNIKSEDTNSAAYGRPTLPNVDGMSTTPDNSLRWNSSFNGENQDNFIMNSSMASGPHSAKAPGVLTVNHF
jgi:hypothetical protein